MARSVATIDSPEFINVRPYNPLISKCEIKVLYVGENRNRSFITKEVAAEMAHSLPGCPIVGYYKEDKQDFSDHGQRVVIDDEGVKFETLTKPYGFVAPDAKVWFQKFEDTDDFGNTFEREYLMTTGYLWTGQYEEVQRVIDEGNPQSMELDEKTLDGKWAMNHNSDIEFFIINDAIFSKLAILGTDVEPCFEGAEITAPKISSTFTMNEEFTHTLFTMMQDLKSALDSREGGLNMQKEELLETQEIGQVDESEEVEVEHTLDIEDAPAPEEEFSAGTEALSEETLDVEEVEESEEEETEEDKYALLEASYQELESKFNKLQEEIEPLRVFKLEVDNARKDELINSFYMLSDEDKQDVIENKSNYSLEEIESKLSVIVVRKKLSFNTEDVDQHEEVPAMTFNLESSVESVPAFVQVLRDVKKN